MSLDKDGKPESSVPKSEPERNVIDITDRLPIRFIGDDDVIRLATKVTSVLVQTPASAAQYLAALGLAGKAVRDLLRASGLSEAQVDAIATEALHISLRYSVNVGNKNSGEDK